MPKKNLKPIIHQISNFNWCPVNRGLGHKEGKYLEYFLKTAIKSGVTPSVLANIPALNDFVNDSLLNLKVMADYDLYRSQYLNRINVDCLNWIYRLGALDQITKNQDGKTQTKALFKLAMDYGLPGERNCGVENMEVHTELGGQAASFIVIRDSISEKYAKGLNYYKLNGYSLIMHLPLVIMLHDYCTYKEYEQDLREAYLGGFIHPRDIGCIYDNAFRGSGSQCLKVPNIGVFGLNSFLISSNIDIEKANRLRAKWEISSIETDRKKNELQKLGFKFIWDYW